jgi:hypothetical protein
LGLAARIRADQPTPKMLPSAETQMLLTAETSSTRAGRSFYR